ncbi:MAG: LPS-assembly protein LptD [Bacteroidales bacterium]|nr:LPS-assembly protein LptD [Bacteroidales bacterium]
MTKVFFDILLVNNSIARFGGRLVRHVSLALLLTVAVCPAAWGQEVATDGLPSAIADSISVADSVKKDSVSSELPLSPNAMEDILKYKAKDSVAFNLDNRRAFIYNEGEVHYQDMELKADAMSVDFNTNLIRASGVEDSNGHTLGKPYFKQGDAEYSADTIAFNYDTKKGIIHGVITQEGEGFLHGQKIKKVNDSVMYLSKGQYTTCNYAHPHYAINFTKSKLIMNDKIVTGPAYISIEDVPTPLAVPFAFFPLTHDRASGFLMPSYGWMNNQGYYLKDIGWYFAINDRFDLALTGDIYTNLSWAAEAKSNYYKRYKYKGNVDIRYGITREGIRGDSNTYNKYSDFKITWRHDQDPKANPNSRFSADVNLQSRNYSKNTTNRNDYFNSTTTSSISYSTKLGSYFNLALAARESFNAQTGLMNIKLPSISLSSVTIYPFRRKAPTGSYKWWENIQFSYQLNAENNVSAQDSELFKKAILNKMQYGIQQSIPLSLSVKVFKYFNWTNSISYNERWHFSTIRKDYDPTTSSLVIDTVWGFRTNRDVSFSTSLSTRIYGMFNFKHGWLKALRHVINPSLSLNYRPNFGSDKLGWWKQYTDATGYVHRYSIFEQSLYGGPADGRSGMVRLNIGNNLEIKVGKWHSTEDFKKVTLLENLNLAMSYDIARDSLNWSDFTVTGRTTLFRTLVLNYSGSFCPYVIDSLGNKHNQFLVKTEHRLFRTDNSTWSAQLSWSFNPNTFKKKKEGEQIKNQGHAVRPTLLSPYNDNPALFVGEYVDFSVPWNISLSYTFSYVSRYVATQYGLNHEVVQSLSVSGNFSITKNWKVAFSTGYDFVNKGLSYTSIDIYRDLHCWEMRFNWTPFGYYKGWNFVINIKAPSLRDVKYEKKKNYQDNQGYYSY